MGCSTCSSPTRTAVSGSSMARALDSGKTCGQDERKGVPRRPVPSFTSGAPCPVPSTGSGRSTVQYGPTRALQTSLGYPFPDRRGPPRDCECSRRPALTPLCVHRRPGTCAFRFRRSWARTRLFPALGKGTNRTPSRLARSPNRGRKGSLRQGALVRALVVGHPAVRVPALDRLVNVR